MSSKPKSTTLQYKVKPIPATAVKSIQTNVTSPVHTGLQQRKYIGVNLKKTQDETKKMQPKLPKRRPVYLGSDGFLYDQDYFKINPGQLDLSGYSDPSDFLNQYNQSKSFSNIFKIPSPDQFEEFFDYEQALLDWKSNMSKCLQDLQLPTVVGRSYYRPKVIPERQRAQSASSFVSNDPLVMSVEIDLEGTSTEKQNAVPRNDLTSDPWDTLLIPVEPDPDDFETYEEYAAAMKRWASVCQSGIHVIPPHASQLKDLIPIQSIQTQKKEQIKEEKQKEEAVIQIHTGLVYQSLFAEEGLDLMIPQKSKKFEKSEDSTAFVWTEGNEWAKLQSKDRVHIWEVLGSWKRTYDPDNTVPPESSNILPIIHGTFPRPENQAASPLPTKNKALRRTDLKGPMLTACLDSDLQLYGRKLEFKIPDYDLNDLDLRRIHRPGAQSGIREASRIIAALTFSRRLLSLNSWYWPKMTPDSLTQQRKFIDTVLSHTRYDEIQIFHVIRVLESNMSLDRFIDLLSENREEEGIMRTHLSCIMNGVTVTTFPQVLAIFDHHSSPLVRAKTAYFLYQSLQSSSRAEALIESLLSRRDFKAMSYLAYAMAYHSDIPISIFSLSPDQHNLIQHWIRPCPKNIIDICLLFYYIQTIQLVTFDNSISFGNIKNYLEKTRNILAQTLRHNLNENKDFLGSKLWKGLAHRSPTISSFCLFMILRLLEHPDTLDCFFSNNISLFDQILNVANSKFSHAQFASRTLWETLFQAGSESKFLEPFKNQFKNKYLELFLAPSISGNVTLSSELVFEMYVSNLNELARAAKQGVKSTNFLIDAALWTSCWSRIHLSISKPTRQTLLLARFLADLTYTFGKIGSVVANQSPKTPMTSGTTLAVNPSILNNLMIFLSALTGKDTKLIMEIRVPVLRTLRQILKFNDVFELIRKDVQFYTKLGDWCRDPEDVQFNREAWKLFYETIYYHHGQVDHMMKTNSLDHFFNMVSTGYPNIVLTNALHYTTKLFLMESTELARQNSGRAPTRISLEKDKEKDKGMRSYEKDIKTLNSFFVQQRLFIKVHMIYKKFSDSEKPYHGASFTELAKLYFTISTSPACEKVLKDTVKTREYKQGLEHIQSMFGEPTFSESPSPSGSFDNLSSLSSSANKSSPSLPTASNVSPKATSSKPSSTASKLMSGISSLGSKFLTKKN